MQMLSSLLCGEHLGKWGFVPSLNPPPTDPPRLPINECDFLAQRRYEYVFLLTSFSGQIGVEIK